MQLLAAAVSANLARTTALRTRVQFEQFFSPELVRELERDPALLEGRSQEVTVLFSDLRGFTSLSQQLGAHNTCRLVRDMMERLSEQIVVHGGVIIDYAGDGILALWNAPAAAGRPCGAGLPGGPGDAGRAAGPERPWHELAGGALALGIGVNTGLAQVGNTGSSRKFKYGPHGHTVNLASRVQDATKKLGLALLLTGSTRDRLPAGYATRRLGQVRMPGVADPVVLYELPDQPPSPEWLLRRDTYETALSLYESRALGQSVPDPDAAAGPGPHRAASRPPDAQAHATGLGMPGGQADRVRSGDRGDEQMTVHVRSCSPSPGSSSAGRL